MQRLERILVKMIVIQFIFLLGAQWLISNDGWAYHLNRVHKYEGIMNGERGETIETIDR